MSLMMNQIVILLFIKLKKNGKNETYPVPLF